MVLAKPPPEICNYTEVNNNMNMVGHHKSLYGTKRLASILHRRKGTTRLLVCNSCLFHNLMTAALFMLYVDHGNCLMTFCRVYYVRQMEFVQVVAIVPKIDSQCCTYSSENPCCRR
eukprot:6085347-Amphidinium_carterae.3